MLDQVHLVDQAKHMCLWTELFQSFDDLTIRLEVLFDRSRLNVEDVNEHFGVREDVLPLGVEIGIHKRILPAWYVLAFFLFIHATVAPEQLLSICFFSV